MIMDENMMFYKNNPDDMIWWVDNPDVKGQLLFSFDKKNVLFQVFGTHLLLFVYYPLPYVNIH